jgi:amino acid transporter
MASSGVDSGHDSLGNLAHRDEKNARDMEKVQSYEYGERRRLSSVKPAYDSTHRKLKPRHIQLIGIGSVNELKDRRYSAYNSIGVL